MNERFLDRIGYKADLSEPLTEVAAAFDLGKVEGYDIILAGYEDCNLHLETAEGEFAIKIFRQDRTDAECERYIKVMRAAVEAGVNHPVLFDARGEYLFKPSNTNLRLVVTEWLKDESYFDSDPPIDEDRVKLVGQAALINAMTVALSPEEYVYDSWAIINFEAEFEKWKHLLSDSDLQLVRGALEEYRNVDVEKLPKAFVHGDLISTNVMLAEGKMWVYDFSVANIYPRTLELAVLLSDMFFDAAEDEADRLYDLLVAEYQKATELTSEEKDALPALTRAAHAMHIIGATKSEYLGEGGSENDSWWNLGRKGLGLRFYRDKGSSVMR